MTSTGIDRETGLPLSGFAHVLQCVDVIFTTRIAEMVMLRWFGCGLPELLGRRITPSNKAYLERYLADSKLSTFVNPPHAPCPAVHPWLCVVNVARRS